MINFNYDLPQGKTQWILEFVVPKTGHRVDHTTLSWWMEAHNAAFKEQVSIPGCSCEYIATMRVWQGRINQYDPQIIAIAYPEPVVEETKPKRGRKKNE